MATFINSRSISFPNTFNDISGQTDLAKEIASINQCIKLLLSTSKGELFGDPDFGCRLQEMLFDQMGDSLNTAVIDDIVNTLNKYETRIFVTDNDISVTRDGRTLKINISYSLRYTDYRTTYQYITKIQEGDNLWQ